VAADIISIPLAIAERTVAPQAVPYDPTPRIDYLTSVLPQSGWQYFEEEHSFANGYVVVPQSQFKDDALSASDIERYRSITDRKIAKENAP